MTSTTSSEKAAPLSKDMVGAKLTQAWGRTIADKFKGNKTAFAAKIGVCSTTIENALSGKTVPEFHTALNSLLACPNALDEVAALFGMQLVPRDIAMTPDMVTLSQMSRAVAEFVEVLSDGKRTHRETLELAEELRPLIPRLTAIVHEAEGLKAA